MDKDQLARIFHVKREDVHIPARRCYDCFLEGYFRHPYLNCGFAIIKLEDCEDIEKKAQEFNDTIFEGRRLVVEVAHVKPRYH